MTPTESTDLQPAREGVIRCSEWLAGQPLMLLNGDCRTVLKELAAESVQCVVTSPPYWGLRDYGHADQIGMEASPEEYVQSLRGVFEEVRRVLRKDGTCWLNLGDCYCSTAPETMGDVMGNLGLGEAAAKARQKLRPKTPQGLKPKDLVGIPWRVAFALQSDGWWLRADIIWSKINCMPESVTDRPTKSHEYLFLLSKGERYHYDASAIQEPFADGSLARLHRAQTAYSPPGQSKHHGIAGERANGEGYPTDGLRNKRSVWVVPATPFNGAHFATFPPDLIKPCVLAGTKPGDVILDPFGGSGTTGMVAIELGRKAILIELNAEYAKLCAQRCAITPGLPLAC